MKKFGYTDERLDSGKVKFHRRRIVFRKAEKGAGRGLRGIEAMPGAEVPRGEFCRR